MTGRAEIHRLKQKLDDAFQRFNQVGHDLEVRADYARYLCVLVSGYLERAIEELATQHCRTRAQNTVLSYVSGNLRRFRNPNTEKILTLVGMFDLNWRQRAEQFIVEERKTAVDSVVALRHQVAHGENTSVTYARISDYYRNAEQVVGFLADLFLPS